MAGKGKSKNRHAASAEFLARNNPGLDVEKVANERYSGGNRGGQGRSGSYNNSYGNRSARSNGKSKYPYTPASASYNFVRLPNHVIPAEFYDGNFEGVTKDVMRHTATMLRKRARIQDILTLPLRQKHHCSSAVHRNKRIRRLLNFMVVKITQLFQVLVSKAW